MSYTTPNDPVLRCFAAPWRDSIEFLFRFKGSVGTSIMLEELPEGQVQKPTFLLSTQQAQVLMDDLWQAGIRPTEGTGSAGSLRATEKHLDDMRAITAKLLTVELPQ